MKKKILILGKNGQLGHALIKNMQKKHSLVSLNKATGNIMNDKLIEKWIIKFNPDFIINAAAYTNVEKAETNKTEAYNVNSKAVLNLSKLSKKYD